MSNTTRLELSSLPQRHPKLGRILQRTYGEAAAVRLSLDPVLIAPGVEEREVVFGHAAVGAVPTVEHRRSVSWAGLFDPSYLAEVLIGVPGERLSEYGAVALAALAVSEFEQAEIVHVLPKGSGGDYHVAVAWRPTRIQLEVSGLAADTSPSGAETAARVTSKCVQVLTVASEGFVSVTAFDHPPSGGPYTLLGYVTRATMRSDR